MTHVVVIRRGNRGKTRTIASLQEVFLKYWQPKTSAEAPKALWLFIINVNGCLVSCGGHLSITGHLSLILMLVDSDLRSTNQRGMTSVAGHT